MQYKTYAAIILYITYVLFFITLYLNQLHNAQTRQRVDARIL